jgi:hypothetical protein
MVPVTSSALKLSPASTNTSCISVVAAAAVEDAEVVVVVEDLEEAAEVGVPEAGAAAVEAAAQAVVQVAHHLV